MLPHKSNQSRCYAGGQGELSSEGHDIGIGGAGGSLRNSNYIPTCSAENTQDGGIATLIDEEAHGDDTVDRSGGCRHDGFLMRNRLCRILHGGSDGLLCQLRIGPNKVSLRSALRQFP
jgi:hypothetical protein